MRARHVVLVGFEDDDFSPPEWDELAALAVRVTRIPRGHRVPRSLLEDVDVLLAQMGEPVTSEMIEAAPRLRYIGVFATSTAFVDVEAAEAHGVVLRNVPGYATQAVAELAIALALEHLRDLSSAYERGARGDLLETPALGRELRSIRAGVLGLGQIGRRLCDILRSGFGVRVSAFHPRPRPDVDVPQPGLDAVLATSELLFCHLPSVPATRGLLDRRCIDILSPGTLILLLCPPAIFDFDALSERVANGELHLVTDHGDELRPADREKLAALPRCRFLPPIGYATREAHEARRRQFLTSLRRFLEAAENPPR